MGVGGYIYRNAFQLIANLVKKFLPQRTMHYSIFINAENNVLASSIQSNYKDYNTMAKVFLDPGDTFNIVEPNVSLFGTTGTETVVIESTAMGTVLTLTSRKSALAVT